ncbi:hypothetical protein ABPG77_003952 [Micractinium sp. CCAP 211/92]
MDDMAAAAAAAVGELVAAVHNGGDCLLEVRLPATALPSDNIRELKKQLGDFMTGFMKQQNMDTEEVDLMEEVVSDGEGDGAAKPAAGGKKAPGSKKRKQHESQKA